MARKLEKPQTSALDEVRRHVRVFIDLSRVAGESNDQNRFLNQAVVQVARAVEIDHVKVLKYRRREADLLVTAGYGWKEGVVRSATLSADLRSPPGRSLLTPGAAALAVATDTPLGALRAQSNLAPQ